jgi:glyoxylase-like metal-dependent hydrolase (beta-lactamase superfamily II)
MKRTIIYLRSCSSSCTATQHLIKPKIYAHRFSAHIHYTCFMLSHQLTVGLLHTNCFILTHAATREAWLIDPGGNTTEILRILETENTRLTRIILTHAHFDHILAAPDVQARTGASLCLHPLEQPVLARAPQAVQAWLGWEWGPAPEPDCFLHQNDTLTLGDTRIEIRHVPGHSPGSIILVDHGGRQAWVGDVLFRESVGRTDLPGGNHSQLIRAINEQILTLPDDYILYPGHGPATTVGHERSHNPFITPELWVG